MQNLRLKLKDRILITGWSMILLSTVVFCIPFLEDVRKESNMLIFLSNYVISLFYFAFLKWYRGLRVEEHRIHYTFSLLILFLISAFSLNREASVFETSPFWLSCLLVLICVNFLLTIFFDLMNEAVRYVSLFICGVAFVLFLYYSFYLMPWYILSIPAMLALGFSIHSFIPLMFCIYIIQLVSKLTKNGFGYIVGFGAGVVTSILTAVSFAIVWSGEVKEINKAYATSGNNNDLPAWVQVASRADDGSITDKVLKTDLVYVQPDFDDFLFVPGSLKLEGQQKVHDPLVVTAALFSKPLIPSEEERIRILESKYNARHLQLERLWSGHSLVTKEVTTHVRVWPEMHLAYTEKTVEVFNHAKGWFKGQEEAIYTFHMPEGAVVTSLSLWVNGIEEKGILTTREKATEAYRAIVGVEKRDPSVIHWQEGNTVSVRVFPVLPDESRRFRIGITAPLQKNSDHLVYDNTWFFGPDPTEAAEEITVEMMGSAGNFARHTSFRFDKERTYQRKGRYKPRWSLQFEEQGLRPHVFSFDGEEYSLQPYNRIMENAVIRNVYLDINNAWTREEFLAVWKSVKDRNVLVVDGSVIKLTEENHLNIFDGQSRKAFSLFPFHEITDVQESLVISKSNAYSPNLDELEGSPFLNRLKNFAARKNKVKFYNLGKELNCYLRSVKEFRLLQYDQGDTSTLAGVLSQNQFAKDQENDGSVVIHNAELSIVKKQGNSPSTAPDHLMRLFAYNHVMHQLGIEGFNSSYENKVLVDEAKKAYVVSPVSSLIVLETQRDYDRFDIKDEGNSLKNASMNSTGAVPEPHEWALIILAIVVVIFLYLKTRF